MSSIWRGSRGDIGGIAGLPNMSMVRAVGSNLPIGDNDIYTVPTGRKCYIVGCRAHNPSAGSIALYHEIKIGGLYYRISATITPSANSGSNVTLLAPIILNSGESISVNCQTTSGLNVSYAAYEFDASSAFTMYRNLALSNGDNVLYTCPSGKTASLGMQHMGFSIVGTNRSSYPGLSVCNGTGGALTYTIYFVPNGGTSGSTNLYDSLSIATVTMTQFHPFATLTAGDFIVVNTSAGTAGQIAWVNVWEI